MEVSQFLDEFRPFRRGELALARRLRNDPIFLPQAHLDVIRYALRLAQISSVGSAKRDALVDRIGFARLRLLQLLAPVLPTDPEQIDASALFELVPRVAALVEGARRNILDSELASEESVGEAPETPEVDTPREEQPPEPPADIGTEGGEPPPE